MRRCGLAAVAREERAQVSVELGQGWKRRCAAAVGGWELRCGGLRREHASARRRPAVVLVA
jgi:hypothetical protein